MVEITKICYNKQSFHCNWWNQKGIKWNQMVLDLTLFPAGYEGTPSDHLFHGLVLDSRSYSVPGVRPLSRSGTGWGFGDTNAGRTTAGWIIDDHYKAEKHYPCPELCLHPSFCSAWFQLSPPQRPNTASSNLVFPTVPLRQMYGNELGPGTEICKWGPSWYWCV